MSYRRKIGARSRTRTWECRCVGPMPWPLGEASKYWCTREDLNLHAARAAASEAAASAVSPRVHSSLMVPQRRIEPLLSALAKRCPAPGRMRPPLNVWCWLEDSNLPPLAYEASALPDELSQLLENRQKDRGAAPGVEATLSGAPRFGAASKSGRSQCQRARRHGRRSHSCEFAVADTRATECARAHGTRVMSGSTWRWSAGHLPSCLIGGGA